MTLTAYPYHDVLTQHSACCVKAALTPEAEFCTTCGKPLIRCTAAAECGSLLDDAGMCPVCVRPELKLDAGAAATVREGGKLALPLMISNASTIGRPLFVTGLWMKEDDGDLHEITLPFQRLEPGASANVAIRTGVLDYAGVHQVDLLIAVATRYQWFEEEYVFASSIMFPVESKDPAAPVTNINVSGKEIGAGLTIYNPTRIENDRAAGIETHQRSIPLRKTRADEEERRQQKRGYPDRLYVPRDVQFEWKGFGETYVPFDGPALAPGGLLSFGRNSRDSDSGANDVQLAVGGKGELNEAATLHISRHHFTLYIASGRLMLRVDSQFGLRVNDQSYGRTKTVILKHGDTITPLRKSPDSLRLTVQFESNNETVTRIIVRRASKP